MTTFEFLGTVMRQFVFYDQEVILIVKALNCQLEAIQSDSREAIAVEALIAKLSVDLSP
jgi:hypothetical protein